jgi:PAS domain-containing protein
MSTIPAEDPAAERAVAFADELDQLRQRVEEAVAEPQSGDTLVHDLQVAYEELRVADEELRTQGEAIEGLVDEQRRLRGQQERMLAILPVAVVVTDRHGVIRAVNAAAATMMDMRAGRLVGKPLAGLFDTADRQGIRRMVSLRAGVDGVEHGSGSVLPRSGAPVAVDIVASGVSAGAVPDGISWVLLPASGPATGSERLADALSKLAVLPQRGAAVADLLEPAVSLCHEAIGADAALSLVLGSPLAPDAVVSTSQLAQSWDGAQLAAGEGPSVTAYNGASSVASRDVRGDDRWPALAELLSEGVAVVATPIDSGGRVVGCLTAYGIPGQTLPEETMELLGLTLGGVLYEMELMSELGRLERDMQKALVSRSVIDQAKGVIMASQAVDERTAWEYLVRLSSTQHRKLRDIARQIVDAVADSGV